MKKIILILTSLLLVACSSAKSNQNSDQFVVGLECNYAPFNWLSTEETETSVYVESASAYCDGYDVRVASAIADHLGLELVVEQITWEGLIMALQSETIDAIIAGMSNTPERAEQVNFTAPYYQSDYVMLVLNDSPLASATTLDDFSGYDIVGQVNTAYDVIIDQIPDVNHLTPLSTYPLIVHALTNEVADGAPAEKPAAMAIVEANPNLTFVEFQPGQGFTQNEDVTTEVSIALNKSDEALLNQINEFLNSLDQSTREQWMNEAIEAQGA